MFNGMKKNLLQCNEKINFFFVLQSCCNIYTYILQ